MPELLVDQRAINGIVWDGLSVYWSIWQTLLILPIALPVRNMVTDLVSEGILAGYIQSLWTGFVIFVYAIMRYLLRGLHLD